MRRKILRLYNRNTDLGGNHAIVGTIFAVQILSNHLKT